MFTLPPKIERFLASLGINTSRLKWKLHYFDLWFQRKRSNLTSDFSRQRYKNCRRCGELALAENKICKCGHKLPSYAAYRMTQLFALDAPQFSIVSAVFLLLIVALFALEIRAFGLGTLTAPTTEALLRFGALAGSLFESGQYWRLFTMALGHIGIIHIGFNVMVLSQVLPRFESEIGALRTLVLITITQLGAGIAHLLWNHPMVVTAGASGVAFGLIGFGVAFAHRLGRRGERRFYLRWCMYSLIFGILIHANNAAHIGGFLAGLPLGYWMGGANPRGAMKKALTVAGVACLIVWLVSIGFLAASIMGIRS